MTHKKSHINQMLIDEWRQLGFYYDLDDRPEVNQWRFYGSKQGLQNFIKLLDDYTSNKSNAEISEHDHYGPYSYLKIMTWDKAVITDKFISGTIKDLKELRNIIEEKLAKSQPGQTFIIDNEYGEDNTVGAKFFIMADDFDPLSMDELIISNRQAIVNKL